MEHQPVVAAVPAHTATANATVVGEGTPASVLASRPWQLALGIVSMVMIASPQYVWALFTRPVTEGLGATLAQAQVTFSLLIVV